MPILPADLQESAANSTGATDFKPLDPGVYTARLAKVEGTRSRSTDKPMWAIEFDTIEDLDGKKAPGRIWSNITLETSTDWKISQFFAAFGAPTSTDTDLLINSRIRLALVVEVQRMGKNAGKEINTIDRYLPLVESDTGYERAQTLKSKLSGGAKAAAPARARAAAVPAEDPGLLANDDDGVDF